MVKFGDTDFQDAYLSSLRQNSFLDTPPPRSRKHHDKESYNAMRRPASPSPNKAAEEYDSPALRRSKERMMERESFMKEYEAKTPPRKKEGGRGRSSSKNREPATPTTPSTPRMKKLWDMTSPVSAVSEAETPRDAERRDDLEYTSTTPMSEYQNSASLWDAARGDPKSPMSDIASDVVDSSDDNSDDSPVWNAARIRREMRRDMTKQAKNDINDIEQFAKSMRKRIQHYSPVLSKKDGTRVVVDDGGGRAPRGRQGRSGRGSRDVGDDDADEGIELRLTDTESEGDVDIDSLRKFKKHSNKATQDDDGYGKTARGGSGKKKKDKDKEVADDDGVDTLLRKFQSRKNVFSPLKTRDDGSDNRGNRNSNNGRNSRNVSRERQPSTSKTSKKEQAKKIASYRGMNKEDDEQDDEESSNNSKKSGSNKENGKYTCSSPRIISPRNARLERIKILNKKQDKILESQQAPPPPPPPPPLSAKEEKTREMAERIAYKTERTDLDDWWKEHKARQQRLRESSEERLENWWKEQQIRKETNRNREKMADVKPFMELTANPSDEPTVDDDEKSPSTPSAKPRGGAEASTNDDLSSSQRSSTKSRMRRASPPSSPSRPAYPPRQRKEGNGAPKSSIPRRPTPSRSQGGATTFDRTNSNRSDRSNGSAASSRNQRPTGPPCPETPQSQDSFRTPPRSNVARSASNSRAMRDTSRSRRDTSNDNKDAGNDGNVDTPEPPSSVVGSTPCGASVLSEFTRECDSRCQSVAQSTLSILLSRIEEAKANFTQALIEGDVQKQTELAALMTRLGEAAVTMRKLEQVR